MRRPGSISNMTKRQFRATLESEADGGHFIRIPFNVPATFGKRGQVPVHGTLNGSAFRASLFPYGGVYYLGVNKALRAAAQLNPGDSVRVVLERDDTPRAVKPPAELSRALKANPGAHAAWKRLSHTQKKEYVQSVEQAKKPETRNRRIASVIKALTRQ